MKSPRSSILSLALVSIVFATVPLSAQWTQTAMLTASDGQTNDAFGFDTAMSNSPGGATVVIGAPEHNQLAGAAYVFTQSNGVWAQVAELTASDAVPGQFFGARVAIDRNTIVVGANACCTFNAHGSAYVFVKPSSGWTNMTETAKLMPSDATTFDSFGSAVGISGNTVVVGAPQHQVGTSQEGTAYIFVKPATGWTSMTQSAELSSSDGTEYGLGQSVAMRGGTVLVQATRSSAGTGVVYVFEQPPSGWINESEIAQLTPTDPNLFDEFGGSLAISADESTIVAGAPRRGDSSVPYGSAYIFIKPVSGWQSTTENAEIFAPGQSRQFGSVAINAQGNLIAVGASMTNAKAGQNGSAYIYRKPATGWPAVPKVSAQLVPTVPQTQAFFGSDVQLTGALAVVGAYGATVNGSVGQGAAYVFTRQ